MMTGRILAFSSKIHAFRTASETVFVYVPQVVLTFLSCYRQAVQEMQIELRYALCDLIGRDIALRD